MKDEQRMYSKQLIKQPDPFVRVYFMKVIKIELEKFSLVNEFTNQRAFMNIHKKIIK